MQNLVSLLYKLDHLYEILNICLFFLEGLLNLKPENTRRRRLNQGRCPVLLPQLPVPSTPPSSTSNPTPPPQNTLLLNSEGQQDNVDSVAASQNIEVQVKEPQADVSPTESMKLYLHSAGPASSPSPPSTMSHGSFSDFSRPPSRVFSRSTNLSGRISGLSGKSKLWN